MTASVDVVDVERAVESDSTRRACRCSIACLWSLVLALYALVLAAGALGFWALQELRADIERSRGPTRLALTGSEPNFKVPFQLKNFAYVRAVSSKVETAVMKWEVFKDGSSSTLGSRYRYNPTQAALMVTRGGSYFLYVQLTLQCTHLCHKGTLHMVFQGEDEKDLLRCDLHVPEKPSSPVTKQCWGVVPRLASGDRLLARMDAGEQDWTGWAFDLNQTKFGIFLVDGPVAD